MEKENVTFRIEPELHRRVKASADLEGISMSDLIVQAIERHLGVENVTAEEEPEEGQGSGEDGPAPPIEA